MEEWRDIVGYAGYYQVSSHGRVRSLDRVVKHPYSGFRRLKGKTLSPTLYSSGYYVVNLCKGGTPKQITVHTLVLLAFVGPCPDGFEACHGKGGALDNRVSNLRWDTHSNNELDKREHGTHRGKRVMRSDGVEFIRASIAAEEMGCCRSSISQVCTGKRKTAGGFGWEFV